VGRGLVEAKTRSAVVEARSGVLTAQAEVEAARVPGQQISIDTLDLVVRRLSDRGATGDLYTVVLLGSPGQPSVATSSTSVADVPADLATRLRASAGPLYTYAPVRRRTAGASRAWSSARR
jgi:hypothetical protein